MDYSLYEINPFTAFPQLRELPQPPKRLFIRGEINCTNKKLVAVVGARRCTSYGKAVCEGLIAGLTGYPIIIVSGLALGIDSIAHRAALDAGLTTIAFPGSSLEWDHIYPSAHRNLAREILDSGGALIAENEKEVMGTPWVFPQRNRLIAGISDMTIIIEAEKRSGTLITARLATEYNKTVGAVPGNINSPMSIGPNWLLSLGAVPITESADILRELHLAERLTDETVEHLLLNTEEENILNFLHEPKSRDTIICELCMDPVTVAIALSTLELKGVIRETLGVVERTK